MTTAPYAVESFIEDCMSKGWSGTLKELIAQSKYERKTEGERQDEGELTPEELQAKSERY